jgi:hypothetical protein
LRQHFDFDFTKIFIFIPRINKKEKKKQQDLKALNYRDNNNGGCLP